MIKIFSPNQSARFVSKYDPATFQLSLPSTSYQLAKTHPLYTHDEATVQRVFSKVDYPLLKHLNIDIYNLPYNLEAHNNGWASYSEWRGKGHVVLGGRTTPIPFVVTEYVLPHEIGHVVQGAFASRHEKHLKARWEEYCRLRGISSRGNKGWHQDGAEVFANDFRILFSPFQHDFWPHSVPHPKTCEKKLRAFMLSLWPLPPKE